MKRLSIRAKIILSGIIVVLIPLSVVGWLSIKDSSETLEEIAYESAKTKAVTIAENIAGIVQTQKSIVLSLASGSMINDVAYEVQQKGWRNSAADVARLTGKIEKTYQDFADRALGIFITDAKGYLYTGAREGGKPYKGSNIASRGYFQQAKASGKPVVSDIVRSKSTGKMISVAAAPLYGPDKEFLGIYAIAFKADWYSRIVLSKQFGKTGRAFMVNSESVVIAHPNKELVFTMNVAQTPGLEELGSRMKEQKEGTLAYSYKGVGVVTGFAPVQNASWIVAVSQNRSEVLARTIQLRNKILTIAAISLVVVIILIFFATRFIVRGITGPIGDVVARLRDIAEGEGDLTMRLDIVSKDELGELAHWFNIFMERMQSVIAKVSSNTDEVDKASLKLSGIAEELSSYANDTSGRANSVAEATEELDKTVTTVAASMEQSTANAAAVGSASEEMSATISQIVESVQEASHISSSAVKQAGKTAQQMEELEQAAQSISKVTETITDISAKTNLLALNATIEAARAGEAGKGFTVVATEIKELAAQTVEATNDIKQDVSGIQGTSNASIAAIKDIMTIINQINEIVSTITVAVEEQSTAAQEITSNITQTSQGLIEINENMSQGASISGEISGDIAMVSDASSQIAEKSSHVTSQASDLQTLSTELKKIVNSFKI